MISKLEGSFTDPSFTDEDTSGVRPPASTTVLSSTLVSLGPGTGNAGLWAKSATACFCKSNFTGTRPHPLTQYCLWLLWQGWGVAAEIGLKYLLIGLLQKKSAAPCSTQLSACMFRMLWNHRCRKRHPCSQGMTRTSENEACLRHVEGTVASDVGKELSSRWQADGWVAQSSYNNIINVSKI